DPIFRNIPFGELAKACRMGAGDLAGAFEVAPGAEAVASKGRARSPFALSFINDRRVMRIWPMKTHSAPPAPPREDAGGRCGRFMVWVVSVSLRARTSGLASGSAGLFPPPALSEGCHDNLSVARARLVRIH